MSATRCPRCGNNIEPKQRFCPECAFPVWEAARVSDQLTNYPVPFRLSDEHRKIYVESGAKAAGGAKKIFVFAALALALALFAALLFIWQNGGIRKNQEESVQQSESAQTIKNTEAAKPFAFETKRQTEAEEKEQLATETEETEKAAIETEKTEQTVIETEETEQTVIEKKEQTEKITEQLFLVTVENGTGGGYYHSGEKVIITADEVPEDSGLEFSGWEIIEGDILLSGRMMETAYFIMPRANVSVTAGLSEIKYTVTVTNGEGGGDYSSGEKVTLTANEPEEEYEFDGWEIKNGDMILSDAASETVYFYMPRSDVEISAVYKKKTYALTVENGTADETELHAGETTVITAGEAADGYIFTGWEIKGDASAEDLQKEQTTLTIGSGEVSATAKYEAAPVLKTGEELQDVFLELADSKVDYASNPPILDKKIKRFCRSETPPSKGMKTKDISEIGRAVQAWYDDSDGTIYWYTDAKTVRLNENSGDLFIGFNALREVDFTGIDTRNIANMGFMFSGCSSLISLDLSGFNTENVTDMRGMFNNCSSLASLDLSGFNTENVTHMGGYYCGMFAGCSSLTSLDLSSFDTRNVTDMTFMFDGCTSLTNLDLSGFNTRNVTDMRDMFAGCRSLTSLDLSSFDTGNVMSMVAMFIGCSSLKNLNLSSFDTRNVTDMAFMFDGCKSLLSLDLSSFDTRNVTDMNYMFSGCRSLTGLKTEDKKILAVAPAN